MLESLLASSAATFAVMLAMYLGILASRQVLQAVGNSLEASVLMQLYNLL